MFEEPKMEKLTINLPPIEIARIDILVEAGFYPSRAEFIRASIRRTLDTHQDFIAQKISVVSSAPAGLDAEEKTSRFRGLGAFGLGKETFEKAIAEGKKMRIYVVGILDLKRDVTPEHIEQAVESAKIYGILRASPKVKEALQRKRGKEE